MQKRETAQTLALRVLGWLVADEALVERLVARTGVSGADLAAMARDPAALASILDFLMADEPLLLRFCRDEGVAPESIARARMALPDGDLPHWT